MVKRLTRRIVAPLRVGSIPTTHPHNLHIIITVGVSPSGKATDFDSVMRWFDPSHPCQHDSLAQLAEHLTFNQGVPAFESRVSHQIKTHKLRFVSFLSLFLENLVMIVCIKSVENKLKKSLKKRLTILRLR